MRIAVDLRPLQIGHQDRGIGSFLLNLLENISVDQENNTFIFLRYSTSNPIIDFGINVQNYEEVILERHSLRRGKRGLIVFLFTRFIPTFPKLRRSKPDVFLQCDYLLGIPRIRGCKTIVVAYDLIPIIFKQMYLPSWKKYFGFKQLPIKERVRSILRSGYIEHKYMSALKRLKKADKIIAISDNTATDLINIAKVNEKNIEVVHLAASFRRAPAEQKINKAIKASIDKIKNPYIVYIGGSDIRRQIDELVLAFNLYNARIGQLNLVLCGNEFLDEDKLAMSAKKAISASSYSSNIYMPGKITEAEKKYILSNASAFVFPTLYEGFGLPILEAMQCGAPVITYKNSSVPEIGGDALVYTPQENGIGIYQSLKSLLSDKVLSAELIRKGGEQAQKFSWQKSADRIWQNVIQ